MTVDDIQVADSNGNTALHLACMFDPLGDIGKIRALLMCNAYKSMKNNLNKTPEELIIYNRSVDKSMKDNLGRLFGRGGESQRYVQHSGKVSSIPVSGSTSELYTLCRDGRVEEAENLLKTMSQEDIDRIQPNGSTALHVACYYGHNQIVELLLEHGASRSIQNSYGCIPYEEADAIEIKNLFHRNCEDRFVSGSGKIDWLLVNPHVSECAAFERNALTFYRNKSIEDLADRVLSYYLSTELKNMSGIETIKYFFRRAIAENDAKYIITAYTSETGFYSRLNHDLALGATKCEAERRYIVGMIVLSPIFDGYSWVGKLYRGMRMDEEDLNQYSIGSKVMTKSFLSGTKARKLAEEWAFSGATRKTRSGDQILKFPAICIYITRLHRTALAIENMSEYKREREVLLMPYSVFTVTSVQRLNNTQTDTLVEIELEECDPYNEH